VVGDVDFDKAEGAVALAGSRSAPRGSMKGWGRLAGTLAEAEAIHTTFDRRLGGTVTDLRGRDATKAAVRAALPRHRYAHLATHGFFAPAGLKSALAGKEDEGLFGRSGLSGWHPLLLSGVVLAGANREPGPDEEDGVLTALEVAEMDLPGCELAVLSACETGLGESAGGEGVLGLQRAFQVAGARATLTSLWQVPDEATAALMQRFYDNLWRRRMTRLEALREAQLWLLREGRRHPEVARGLKRGAAREDATAGEEAAGRLPPLYWAAFVLSGDWR
jgi:CHAT domain-containing protein